MPAAAGAVVVVVVVVAPVWCDWPEQGAVVVADAVAAGGARYQDPDKEEDVLQVCHGNQTNAKRGVSSVCGVAVTFRVMYQQCTTTSNSCP